MKIRPDVSCAVGAVCVLSGFWGGSWAAANVAADYTFAAIMTAIICGLTRIVLIAKGLAEMESY